MAKSTRTAEGTGGTHRVISTRFVKYKNKRCFIRECTCTAVTNCNPHINIYTENGYCNRSTMIASEHKINTVPNRCFSSLRLYSPMIAPWALRRRRLYCCDLPELRDSAHPVALRHSEYRECHSYRQWLFHSGHVRTANYVNKTMLLVTVPRTEERGVKRDTYR